MFYKIGLKRFVSNNNLRYYIIVFDSNGVKPLEKLGFYSVISDNWHNKYVYIDIDRLLYWLNKGLVINPTIFSVIQPLLYFYKSFYKIS